jgi:hypothetical protein
MPDTVDVHGNKASFRKLNPIIRNLPPAELLVPMNAEHWVHVFQVHGSAKPKSISTKAHT